ncbi:MAG: tRNA uracil 4-sulfurtransferase ThiI [Methanosarcinales archaeon]
MIYQNIILVRYGEIALKSSKVRNRYEKILINNIKKCLDFHNLEYSKITREWGRIYVHTLDKKAINIITRVFGVVSASYVYTTESNLDAISLSVAEIGKKVIKNGESFAIRARRAGVHDFTSREVGVVCGAEIAKKIKNPVVDLTNPDKEIFVEVRQDLTYIFTEIIKGVGGLPLGTQGKMVALISGGIDSPVAAWLMMKRGCNIIPVYCNNYPFADETTLQRAMDCIDTLQKWSIGHKFKIYEVPNGENLIAILKNCNNRIRKLTCVLCRRMMYRIAIEVAKRENAHGIITGASLGQVASQTSLNMLAEMYGMNFPIYHPLIGMDKTEITDLARLIGTFDDSTKPAQCCTATPEYPATAAKWKEVIEFEKSLDIEELLQNSVDNAIIR